MIIIVKVYRVRHHSGNCQGFTKKFLSNWHYGVKMIKRKIITSHLNGEEILSQPCQSVTWGFLQLMTQSNYTKVMI